MAKPKTKQKQTGLWAQIKQGAVIQYLITGVIIFYADYLVFWLGYSYKHWNLAVSQAAAYVVGIVVNFVMERYWVFKHQTKNDPVEKESGRYFVILVVNYFLTYAILKVLQHYGVTPLWGKYAAAFFFTFWNYIVFRWWVFKGPKRVQHRKHR